MRLNSAERAVCAVHSLQPLPNHFGLLLLFFLVLYKGDSFVVFAVLKSLIDEQTHISGKKSAVDQRLHSARLTS